MSQTTDQLAAGYETTIGGHRLRRLIANKNEWECRDCNVTGDAGVFEVGFDGCPGRPESFRQGFVPTDQSPVAAQARAAWREAVKRTTMQTTGGLVCMESADWEDVDTVPGTAAIFKHRGRNYRLKYGSGRNPESTYVYAVLN